MALLPFKFNAKTIIEKKRTTQLAVDTIKVWMDSTSLPQLQEEFIVLFLLSNLNDIVSTKKTVEAYFRVKNKAPYIFNGWSLESEDMKKMLQVIGCCVIPSRMDNNTAITCVKLNDADHRKYDVLGAIKYCCMIFHLCQINDPPNELIIVFDFKGFGFMHLTCLKMRPVISYLEYIQEAIPLKIKKFHILNSNSVIHKLLSLFKFFIKSELLNLIEFHSPGMKMEDFHEKWVPASCLPEEYGGSLPPFEEMAEKTVEELRKMQPFFEAEERLRCSYNHEKRV